jgi:hypothetical protein
LSKPRDRPCALASTPSRRPEPPLWLVVTLVRLRCLSESFREQVAPPWLGRSRNAVRRLPGFPCFSYRASWLQSARSSLRLPFLFRALTSLSAAARRSSSHGSHRVYRNIQLLSCGCNRQNEYSQPGTPLELSLHFSACGQPGLFPLRRSQGEAGYATSRRSPLVAFLRF